MQNASFQQYQREHIDHWDRVARQTAQGLSFASRQYQQQLIKIYRFRIGPGNKVLEIGCAQGDLLASLNPSYGVGIDFSSEMIHQARQRHSRLHFIQADAHKFDPKEEFDFIILSDLLNDVWDVQTVLEHIYKACTFRTRIIMNLYSRLWQLPLAIGEALGLSRPRLEQNWLVRDDIAHLLTLENFEMMCYWQEILLPFSMPLLERSLNGFVVRIPPFNLLALTNFIIARRQPKLASGVRSPSVSVIIPARNEAENIPSIFERVPTMGSSTELVFVEGHSTDNTYAVIQQAISEHPEWRCKLLRQPASGKGDAVRFGFDRSDGDILMILDADLTVPPEYLPRFLLALVSRKGDFVNGVRLVYPMEKGAMQFFNILGNKFFSLAFSWLLGQPIKDTLCGTKALWKEDYDRIATNRSYFGEFDPFGDFDLLFGASKLGLSIIDLPIRYHERVHGTTNIRRWKHGLLLLRMMFFAAKRIKFV